jgi:lysophospholipase L1-like esterase
MKTISPDTATSKPISWKAKLGLIFFGVFVACVVLEIGMRVNAAYERRQARAETMASQTPTGEYWAIYDEDLGYRQNPKFGDMNADGLRDHPISSKDESRPRVLFLGDSIAQNGDSVDDTFVAYMRQNLRQQRGLADVDVINAGTKGYTNYQELSYLKKYGLKFQPDVVGVEFCLNDLHKFLHAFRVENKQIVYGSYQFSEEAESNAPAPPRTLAQRVVDKSYLLGWLKNNVGLMRRIISWKINKGYSFDYRIDITSAWQDDGWVQIEKQFEQALQLGRSNDFKMFVVVVPVASQYDPQYLARDRSYVLKPQRKLKEICDRLNIPFYDLYPDLSANLFVDDGIHLTKEGRQIVGKNIALFLSNSNLAPELRQNKTNAGDATLRAEVKTSKPSDVK